MTATAGTPRVVVGVDGSESSKHALRWAAYLAKTSNAQLDVIATWQISSGWGSAYSTVPTDWNPQQDLEKSTSETIDEVFGSTRPENLRVQVRQGYAVTVLLDESKDALMLVVGSRGHGGFTGLLLGSVSAALAEHASCPVLVAHGEQLPPS
jgi:nucleotide-binding universal stress UspA family protein